MLYDENDIQSAALCAWKEARGEKEVGMQAVLFVLRNRVGFPGFAHTLHDVIYNKNQFTSMSVPGDPEFNLEPVAGDEFYSCALHDANEIFSETINFVGALDIGILDITKGAHYYANLHNVTSGWFYDNIVLNSDTHPVTAQIGRHTFFY